MTYTDISVTIIVVAIVLYAAWRAGQTNPVGTGRLARRMNHLEVRVGELDSRMDGIERSVSALAEASAATSSAVQAMRVELAADRGVTERTWEAVDRIQRFFMDEGLKRMAGGQS